MLQSQNKTVFIFLKKKKFAEFAGLKNPSSFLVLDWGPDNGGVNFFLFFFLIENNSANRVSRTAETKEDLRTVNRYAIAPNSDLA